MYFPYFYGKQFELMAIRESLDLLKTNKTIPIIEPVRDNLKALESAAKALCNNGIEHIVITNPDKGDFRPRRRGSVIEQLDCDIYRTDHCVPGYIIRDSENYGDIRAFFINNNERNVALIFYGDGAKDELLQLLEEYGARVKYNIFIDGRVSEKYQSSINPDAYKILIKDGFNKAKKNAEYPNDEFFSDIHLSYKSRGYYGFGDFTIVGGEFFESGGPAHAVAIHMTYLDHSNIIRVAHFISDTNDNETNPQGKFREAVYKLANQGSSYINPQTDAFEEFKELSASGKYRGLGYVKKLSMKHHMEVVNASLLQAKA